MNQNGKTAFTQFQGTLKLIDDGTTILEAYRSVKSQINEKIEGISVSAEEFAAAMETQLFIDLLAHQIELMRNPELSSDCEESYHAE